jgi:hypothetical protein
MSELYVIGLALCAVLLGCSSKSPACTVGADCASGQCRSDGTCVPMIPKDDGAAPMTDAGGSTDSAGGDAMPPPPMGDASTGCMDNGDWTVARSEAFFASGLHASFLIAENVTVSTAGVTQPDGSRTWDLSAPLSGDHGVVLTTQDVASAWYGPDFMGATYSAKLSDTQPLLGVFTANDSALLLDGVVSPSGGQTRTEVTYSPQVTTLQFPLTDGATWTTTANVTGYDNGIPVAYAEQYQSSVDAHGVLKTPLATFRVLRVSVVLTHNAGVPVIIRSFLFVTDCFGTIATITSGNDEPQAEFTMAAEVERLAP